MAAHYRSRTRSSPTPPRMRALWLLLALASTGILAISVHFDVASILHIACERARACSAPATQPSQQIDLSGGDVLDCSVVAAGGPIDVEIYCPARDPQATASPAQTQVPGGAPEKEPEVIGGP